MRFTPSFFLLTAIIGSSVGSPAWSTDERQLLIHQQSERRDGCFTHNLRKVFSCFFCCSGCCTCCGRPDKEQNKHFEKTLSSLPSATVNADPFTPPATDVKEVTSVFDRNHQPDLLPDEYWLPDKQIYTFAYNQLDRCLLFLESARQENRTDIRLALQSLFFPQTTNRHDHLSSDEDQESLLPDTLPPQLDKILEYVPQLHSLTFEACALVPIFFKTLEHPKMQNLERLIIWNGAPLLTYYPLNDVDVKEALDILAKLPRLPYLKKLKICSYRHEQSIYVPFVNKSIFQDRFPALKKFSLSHNALSTSTAASVLDYFPHITHFNVSGNQIDFEQMSPFLSDHKHYPTLTGLHLNFQKAEVVRKKREQTEQPRGLLFASPEFLTKFTHLTALSVSGMKGYCGVEDHVALRTILAHLPALEHLKVQHNGLSYLGASAIAEHTKKLKSLDISYNQIDDKGVDALAQNLLSLQKLYARRVGMTSAGAIALSRYSKKLLFLFASGNQIDDEGARALATLPLLKALTIQGKNLSSEAVEDLMRRTHRLQFLRLKNAPITNKAIEVLTENCLPRLRALELPNSIGTGHLGDIQSRRIADAFPELAHLNLIGATISGDTLRYLSEKLPHLVTLGLTWAADHRAVMMDVLKNLPSLMQVDLISDIFDCLYHMSALEGSFKENAPIQNMNGQHMNYHFSSFLPRWMQSAIFMKYSDSDPAVKGRFVVFLHDPNKLPVFFTKLCTIDPTPFSTILKKLKNISPELENGANLSIFTPEEQQAVQALWMDDIPNVFPLTPCTPEDF